MTNIDTLGKTTLNKLYAVTQALFVKAVGRSKTESRRFHLKLELSAVASSCCFRSNGITRNASDHQTSLSIIWYNLSHPGLG